MRTVIRLIRMSDWIENGVFGVRHTNGGESEGATGPRGVRVTSRALESGSETGLSKSARDIRPAISWNKSGGITKYTLEICLQLGYTNVVLPSPS